MPTMTVKAVVNKLVERSNTNTRRLRELEQQVNILATRIDSLQESGLEGAEKEGSSLKETQARLDSHEQKLTEISESIKQIVEQLKKAVTEARVQEIEALIDAYNPLKSNFVTKQEVQRMLKR